MTMHINNRFSEIIGNRDYDISLQAMEVDPTKVLGSLKMLMANRSVSDFKLGAGQYFIYFISSSDVEG